MPEINPGSEAGNQSSLAYWCDELKNTKELLYEYNKAILALTTGGHQSYELDTGQTRQRVTRMDLSNLNEIRESLLSQIHDLEIKCGVNGHGVSIVRPAF
jgi:hypothetical protein